MVRGVHPILFTTSSLASVLTGQHPSEHAVYHLPGRLLGVSARRTLPRLMRTAGYSAGASVCNPAAYFLAEGVADDYDVLPEPAYRTANFMRFWTATQVLHQRQPLGSRTTEFWDLEAAWDYTPQHLEKISPRLFAHTQSDFSPAASFAQAQEVLGRMPDGYFLWVHVFAPHAPYLPNAANLGRFLPSDEMRTAEDELLFHRYSPDQQGLVDKARLRYDEFIAETDSAFGSFLSSLESAGSLKNTAVIVSADHGESFEGGVYSHDSIFQIRPEIHIPLMIRMPGQENGSRVALAADQTALAPTILDIAGVPRADWMRGQSLLPWLNRNGEGEGEGLAFTQYLATNSIFKPISKGTVGVIDGRHQYVLNLASGKGILRGLDEAQSWNLDRSAENPALAQTFRDAIYTRFPDLPRRST